MSPRITTYEHGSRTTRYDCGCTVEVPGAALHNLTAYIAWCPLHAAAEEMREHLQAGLAVMGHTTWAQKARALLATISARPAR